LKLKIEILFFFENMFYYCKEHDVVCNLDQDRMVINFGADDHPFRFEDDEIRVLMNGYTYFFYPSYDSPRLDGNGENSIHLYPIQENLVLHSEGSYIYRESANIEKLLKEAYIMLRRAMVEEIFNPDGSENEESFEWCINDAHGLSKKILIHLDRDNNEVETSRQKIEHWSK